MKPLCCSVLLLCLSACSESTAIVGEPGESITLTCSSSDCPQGSGDLVGFYLYHEFRANEKEVFFINKDTPDKAVPRDDYKGRVRTEGAFGNLTITIGNLTADDSGLYRCVYKRRFGKNVTCNTYAASVTDGFYSCGPKKRKCGLPSIKAPVGANECPPLSYYIIISCAISLLVTAAFFLLLRVKKWCNNRRTRRERRVSNDYVYEDMRKSNGPIGEAPLHPS